MRRRPGPVQLPVAKHQPEPETPVADLDGLLGALAANKDAWVDAPNLERIDLLKVRGAQALGCQGRGAPP